MRRVFKKLIEYPESLIQDKCQGLLEHVCMKTEVIKNDRAYASESVKKSLNKIYGKKCAYCESYISVVSYECIDHFRPKQGIKGLSKHKGYYWLVYEWSNLIQSCSRCNTSKSNHFPLSCEKKRAPDMVKTMDNGRPAPSWMNPEQSPLVDEKRLLINPEWDDVTKHFYFTLDGRINAITQQGEVSIIIYDLNRDDLVLSRRTKYENYLNDIKSHFVLYKNISKKCQDEGANLYLKGHLKNIIQQIYDERNIEQTYTGYGVSMIECFDKFFLHPIEEENPECKKILLDVFEQFFITKNLL